MSNHEDFGFTFHQIAGKHADDEAPFGAEPGFKPPVGDCRRKIVMSP